MGSTTTDIIPVRDGLVVAKGKTDSERLQFGELVYVGADRTAVCSIIDKLEFRNSQVSVANEIFATVADAMLLCGFAHEDSGDTATADGRPRTIQFAAKRICRMICEDFQSLGMDVAKNFARQTLNRIEILLREAMANQQLSAACDSVLITGSGYKFLNSFLKEHFCQSRISTLSSHCDESIDEVAPAWAVAVLASESQS